MCNYLHVIENHRWNIKEYIYWRNTAIFCKKLLQDSGNYHVDKVLLKADLTLCGLNMKGICFTVWELGCIDKLPGCVSRIG